MNDKGHFYYSIVKSFLRIATCAAAVAVTSDPSVYMLAIGFAAAEIIGIAEELVDKR